MSILLEPLAAVYGLVASARSGAYRRGWITAKQLKYPVISVGNLTAGGTGKTPLVALVSKLLLNHGLRPAILTRGYRRGAGPSVIALDPKPARSADPRLVGDEPAWLARELPEIPIVIGADRYRAGRLAEQRYGLDLHLMDDGFQHLSLCRNVDIVAVDSTRGLSDRALFPAGLQRERCAALRRAHFLILTRSDQEDAALREADIQELAPQARIFRARTQLCGWNQIRTGQRVHRDGLPNRTVYAFCGIGNPAGFFHDLTRWGFDLRGTRSFPDHHVYSANELRRLSSSAREFGAMLVTTEKDAMNFPATHECDAWACRIEFELTEAETFMEVLIPLSSAGRGDRAVPRCSGNALRNLG